VRANVRRVLLADDSKRGLSDIGGEQLPVVLLTAREGNSRQRCGMKTVFLRAFVLGLPSRLRVKGGEGDGLLARDQVTAALGRGARSAMTAMTSGMASSDVEEK
jgi:hypothetical protein